tara:strand:- start:299 stop:619 length:321 start_codon:yes stop_codon:yes gene_type:complete
MPTATVRWMNDKGEVYELIVDKIGTPVNFTLDKDDNVTLNDLNQKPVEIIDISTIDKSVPDIMDTEDVEIVAPPIQEIVAPPVQEIVIPPVVSGVKAKKNRKKKSS